MKDFSLLSLKADPEGLSLRPGRTDPGGQEGGSSPAVTRLLLRAALIGAICPLLRCRAVPAPSRRRAEPAAGPSAPLCPGRTAPERSGPGRDPPLPPRGSSSAPPSGEPPALSPLSRRAAAPAGPASPLRPERMDPRRAGRGEILPRLRATPLPRPARRSHLSPPSPPGRRGGVSADGAILPCRPRRRVDVHVGGPQPSALGRLGAGQTAHAHATTTSRYRYLARRDPYVDAAPAARPHAAAAVLGTSREVTASQGFWGGPRRCGGHARRVCDGRAGCGRPSAASAGSTRGRGRTRDRRVGRSRPPAAPRRRSAAQARRGSRAGTSGGGWRATSIAARWTRTIKME